MEATGWSAERVQEALDAVRARDRSFAAGEILGSMCTEPHPVAQAAYARFLPTNLGDPDHFPGTASLETEVLQDVIAMVGGGPAAGARFLTGGTEANLLACYLAREATGKTEIVLSDAAHFSFEKAARLLGMRRVRVPCGPDLRSDPEALAAAIGPDTALVVAIAGSTELGLVDDVGAIAAAALAAGVPCHVDAAFGGYVLPFIDGPAWDLRVPGVSSIGLDPHKMGQAPVPAGVLVLADEAGWSRSAVATDYVSTEAQSTLMGTRPGAAVAATWAVHRALGTDGYRAAATTCLANARHLAAGLRAAGADLVADLQLNVVTFWDDDPRGLHARLAEAGFRLNVVPRFGALRVVVGPHVTRAVIDRFLDAYRSVRP